jgi:hypothetical protein
MAIILVIKELRRYPMKKIIASSIAFFFLLGCASATLIKSNPPGAKLYLDGQLKGETPYTYADRAAAGTMKSVTLKKEDYKDFTGHIKREVLSVGALIGGLFFLIPLIWILEYPPEYIFEMEKTESKLSDTPQKPQVTPPEKPVTTTPVAPSPGTANILTVNWTFANIRSGAGDNYPVVTTVKQGDKLTVIGESGDWFNVRLENGQEGWISNKVAK